MRSLLENNHKREAGFANVYIYLIVIAAQYFVIDLHPYEQLYMNLEFSIEAIHCEWRSSMARKFRHTDPIDRNRFEN